MKIIQVLPKLGINRLFLYFFPSALWKKITIQKILRNLSEKKTYQKSDIPLRIVKENRSS